MRFAVDTTRRRACCALPDADAQSDIRCDRAVHRARIKGCCDRAGADKRGVAREGAAPQLRLHAGGAVIPHPAKVAKGGEDAHFISGDGLSLGALPPAARQPGECACVLLL